MTTDRQPTISALQLAKALHPAAAGRPQRPQPDARARGAQAPAAPTGPRAAVLAVLWEEEVCRARLRSVAQGWLSCPTGSRRLPITIAAVEGDDVLLVLRETPGLGRLGAGRPGVLEVGGVTAGSGRWIVRASGLVQAVVPDDDPGATGGSGMLEDPSASRELVVLALTMSSIRGFETTGRPARP